MTDTREITKVAYEIFTRYGKSRLHFTGTAIFDQYGKMQEIEADNMNQNGIWTDVSTKHHELSYWQRDVSIEDFIAAFDGKIVE